MESSFSYGKYSFTFRIGKYFLSRGQARFTMRTTGAMVAAQTVTSGWPATAAPVPFEVVEEVEPA